MQPLRFKLVFGICLAVALGIALFSYHLFIGPTRFKGQIDQKLGGLLIHIEEGSGAKSVAGVLDREGVISSDTLFLLVAAVLGDSKHVVAGYYLFKHPVGVIEAEQRISGGDFGVERIKITFPEGFTLRQITDRLEANMPFFDRSRFMDLASTSEGYLFPDTYFFVATDEEEVIFSKLRSNFDSRTSDFFASSTLRSKRDIITMASIIEREVTDPKDMQIVSGIFWKRIKMGMALQADSTLAYERGKASAELTTDDLRTESPYNTYTNTGLPPTPISNPGRHAINAALYPLTSSYLYFLTDKEGRVYYARTFEEHKANKAKYL